ncbi:hypothetical protein [Methylobacterium currus]|uniref:hypothetical protein n=1 Tax=Methylobacterium currus TaxID=2051553 RepID=UPI000F4EF185|nr:hypothetical protein [Methylobacterium currus]
MIGAATVMMGAALAAYAVLFLEFPSGGNTLTETYPSPEKTMSAVVVTKSGGGGLSPYCTARIYVVENRPLLRKFLYDNDEVFAGDCLALVDFETMGTPHPVLVRWLSDALLQIRVRVDNSPVSLHSRDRTRKVRVAFLFDDLPSVPEVPATVP